MYKKYFKFLCFFIIIILLSAFPLSITNADTSINPSDNAVKNLTGDNVKEMVNAAPSDNFLIWAFLIIAIFILITVLSMLKISSTNYSKNIKMTLEPITTQMSDTLLKVQQSSEKMADKFTMLAERIVEMNAYRDAEDDKFDMILNRMQEVKSEISNSNGNLHKAYREQQKSFADHDANTQKNLEIVRERVDKLQLYCEAKNSKVQL